MIKKMSKSNNNNNSCKIKINHLNKILKLE